MSRYEYIHVHELAQEAFSVLEADGWEVVKRTMTFGATVESVMYNGLLRRPLPPTEAQASDEVLHRAAAEVWALHEKVRAKHKVLKRDGWTGEPVDYFDDILDELAAIYRRLQGDE